MVYCGKPSKACGECRVRRTKCDYVKPNCSQCIRMGRTCSGYRDPVDSMFRDESKGFATKRPRGKSTKKVPSQTSHKSSREIDQAFTACSIAFVSALTNTSDKRCENPLSLESDLANEDQDLFFPGAVLDSQKFHRSNNSTKSDKYVGEFGGALFENLSSLGSVVGLSKSWNASDTMVDMHARYNMALIDRFCFGSGANDGYVPIDPSLESLNTLNDKDCLEMGDMFDFDCFTEKEILTGFPLRTPEPEFCNKPPLMGLSDSSEMQALCYFFANYVLEDTTLSKGYLDFLPSLCISEDGGSFLMDAVASLGLAGLGMRKHDPNALDSARLKYASALRELNTALTSKDGALTDQALTTVFLMGLYEITYCHHRRIPIPDFILEWSREMLEHETPGETMATTLCLVTSKVCALRADMKYFRNYSKSASAVPRAIEIDDELEAWADNCTVSYERRTPTSTEHSEFMFGDHFDVYSSVTLATVWNEYRRMRLLCHEIVLQHLPHIRKHRADYPDFELSDQEIETQLHISKMLLDGLSHDICASVPFYFGVSMNGGGSKQGPLSPKAVCGNLLLRPLYMAAEPIFVSNDVKKWVIGRFETMAEVMGVKQATAMGHLVSIGVDPDEWEDSIQD